MSKLAKLREGLHNRILGYLFGILLDMNNRERPEIETAMVRPYEFAEMLAVASDNKAYLRGFRQFSLYSDCDHNNGLFPPTYHNYVNWLCMRLFPVRYVRLEREPIPKNLSSRIDFVRNE
jgi:hypothetical protein